MKRGRPPANGQPATAYEYRRYIELVQVLAMPTDEGIWALCKAWDIEPVVSIDYEGRAGIQPWSTLKKLAQHVIEYHRAERKP